MCGIAGIFSKKPLPHSPQLIGSATKVLAHRGPESEGYWCNNEGTIALGHKRLCIIDLHERSAQPFLYLNRYRIVHNGELYNYIEVKEQLQKKGYVFTTASDTEVIVAAYDAYQKNCLEQFDGMFAFAIWDEKEQVLFAARDRFGEKPFFFSYTENKFLFGSEMKALWTMGLPKEVNHSLLYNYLTIGYTANPFNQQETFYKDIQKLPAASFLIYSKVTHELSLELYWQPDATINTAITEEEAIDRFTQLLSTSITRRLRSDVAIGTSLSGGLDSSSIVAFCAGLSASHYTHKCFTAVFKGFEKNEEQQAAAVASHFGLQHYLVTMDEEKVGDEMDRLMWYQEEPVGSASVLAQYKVYEKAKQEGVTVLLDGQGADELMGGYHKYYKWYWQELFAQKKLRSSNEQTAARTLGVTEPFGWKNKTAALFPQLAMALLQSSKAKKAFKQPFLNRDFAREHKNNFYYSPPLEPTLNGALNFNSFVYGLEELLRYADRNSMAHAVEVRLPFLYSELASFLVSLPAHFKINGGWTKWILRKSVDPLLSASITWRKDKVGFEPPQKLWMANAQVQERIIDSKKLLVENKILQPEVLRKKVVPANAFDDRHHDWRYWSASYLFH